MFRSLAVSTTLVFCLVLVGPLAVCAVYSRIDLGSIGPWVPGWGIVTFISTPFAIYMPIANRLASTRQRLAAGVVAVALAMIVAILAVNTLMVFSYIFGLNDYAQG